MKNIKLKQILIGVLVLAILIAGIRFFTRYEALIGELNRAKELIEGQKLELATIDTLRVENTKLLQQKKILEADINQLLKDHKFLLGLYDNYKRDLKKMKPVDFKTDREIKALRSDLERHRNYLFRSDSLIYK